MTEEVAAGYHRTKRRGSTMIEWLMALVMAGIVALWLYQNGKDGK